MMADSRFLLVSAHDYRTRRKVNVHFVADELKRRGAVTFFSVAYSLLSRLKGRDPRLGQDLPANRMVRHEGVDCYLWKTLVHPGGGLRQKSLRPLMDSWFRSYAGSAPPALAEAAAKADVVVVESGIGVLFLETIRRANPRARIVYLASDDLTTIGIHPYVIEQFQTAAAYLDYAVLPSPLLAASMPAGLPCVHVPHGLDIDPDADVGPTPFAGGVTGVCVGSMLFDVDFFRLASEAAPEVSFHAIGSGVANPPAIPRVTWHAEMRYADTLRYLKHAHFGIAPYKQANAPYYLADTSMKLMQFGCFGLPAVCPEFTVGRHAGARFGYRPGDQASIGEAIRRAVAAGRIAPPPFLTWRDVVDRILEPAAYPDTAIRREPASAS